MNPCAGVTDLLVFEARPFSLLGTPPFIELLNFIKYNAVCQALNSSILIFVLPIYIPNKM